MIHLNPGNMWEFNDTGLIASLDFGKYQKATAVLPFIYPDSEIPLWDIVGQELKRNSFAIGESDHGYGLLPKMDETNRVLLTAGVKGGYRGGVEIVEDISNATILARCAAASKVQSAIRFAVLLTPSKQVTIRSWTRDRKNVQYHVFQLKDNWSYCFRIMAEREWLAANNHKADFTVI
jgi:hypothetical protein